VPFPWIIAGAAVGLLAGPRIRASVFLRSTKVGEPPRRTCPACSHQVLPGRWRWCPVLPVTGRCPACQTRIGHYPLLAESAAGLALAVVAARATSVWELAALAWLILAAVPLALIDVAVHRLPDPLTAAAFAGTLVLLAAAALAGHQPGHLARAVIGAAALACFYLALCLIRPGEMGLGDAKLAASIGLVLGWASWQALLTGTFAGFALAAVYGGVQMARNKATRNSQLPLGPFILLGVLAALVLLHARPARGARSTAPSRPVQHGVLPLLRRHDVQQPGDRGSLEITAPGRADVALLLLVQVLVVHSSEHFDGVAGSADSVLGSADGPDARYTKTWLEVGRQECA
jgi:leader peptidase (prepilin peptidase)/N-methyltransferase